MLMILLQNALKIWKKGIVSDEELSEELTMYLRNPFISGRMLHKANFLEEYYWSEIQSFLKWNTYILVDDLVGWVLWHINLCRLFNAKSIFIQIFSSISNYSV